MSFDKNKLKKYEATMTPIEQVLTNTYNTNVIIDAVNDGSFNGEKGDGFAAGYFYDVNNFFEGQEVFLKAPLGKNDFLSFEISGKNPADPEEVLISGNAVFGTSQKAFIGRTLWVVNPLNKENVLLLSFTISQQSLVINRIGSADKKLIGGFTHYAMDMTTFKVVK